MSDHEWFCVHDNLCDIIQSTDQENNVSLKIISNEPNENDSQCDAIYICDENICKRKSNFGNNKLPHNLQRKRQKNPGDYRNKLFDKFRLTNIEPPPKLACEDLKVLSVSFGLCTYNQSKEVISMRVLNHTFNHGDEIKTKSNHISTDMYPS